ncbi:cobyric acid synthase [Alicyclobacillus sp. ALC3]|uniref:cobyric acid synthase n=1 Tax=Alicyclobacillus sp. ALC3 TaxID=2796143 RepID=UPI00237940DA|nr:cobyric acid synthase [Alicyclobacillus sp. ALC3]WDL97570.1 cobyric acid synthase [Alicyclobacillus sp. ALC3]
MIDLSLCGWLRAGLAGRGGEEQMTRSIMVVGTASNVGKSIVATALCRILTQDGYRVAPFKAQNMSLNSAVTPSGREIGRAQAVQAEACGILPSEHMNPVLLKPTGDMKSQVVLQGRPVGTRSAKDYFYDEKNELWQAVTESYRYLAERYEVVVIEGAGSPVEMNLKARDIANMKTACMADACVILVADIDRGGVFASVVGTLQLLAPKERALVKGIVVNKFRGDPSLFEAGRTWLESYTGTPVLGVLPYLQNLGIDEEDSVSLSSERYHGKPRIEGSIAAAVVRLPHIANFTDIDPLFLEPDVHAYFCDQPDDLADADVVVLPGTKSTLLDLDWLHKNGWSEAVLRAVERGSCLLGICGGFQMLGTRVVDPLHLESELDSGAGLGVFDATTTIQADKYTKLVQGNFAGAFEGIPVEGYEIHMGTTQFHSQQTPLAFTRPVYDSGNVASPVEEGCVSADGKVIGTYLHGVLHNDAFRVAWLNVLRREKGLPLQTAQDSRARQAETFDRLATTVRTHLRMDQLYNVVFGGD